MPPTQRHFPVIILGAGQAGLAAAHELTQRGLTPGRDFLILDANEGPGGAWRHRWDSLTLGKAHGIADLPGLRMKRPDPAIPSSRLVAEYYGAYEDTFDLQVLRPAWVGAVESLADAHLHLSTTRGEFTAAMVLNATGTWDAPYIPYIPGINTFEGIQLHTRDYVRKEDFQGKRTLVVGGGLSAVQFLLELAEVTHTWWATRRPPNFISREFHGTWGLEVEAAVREQTLAGKRPASVVRTTGIPQNPDYLQGVCEGVLVSHGMFDQITPQGVIFGTPDSQSQDGLGPAAGQELILPESWQPYPIGTELEVDVIFWNTGFRPAIRHLAPLKLRSRAGGIHMKDEVRVATDQRILLVGYGSAASTVGATRAGRRAGRVAYRWLNSQGHLG